VDGSSGLFLMGSKRSLYSTKTMTDCAGGLGDDGSREFQAHGVPVSVLPALK
jgi:hypothetical protein